MGFEEAHAAMEQSMGGGPVSPERLNPSTGSAPQQQTKQETKSTDTSTKTDILGDQASQKSEQGESTTQQEQLEELLDVLSMNKKVKIGDEVYTPEELKRSLMRWKDYTQKTQNLAQERKELGKFKEFSEAFDEDLELVLKNPELESKFREIYPESFQKVFDRIKESRQETTDYNSTRAQAEQQQANNPELNRILQHIQKMDSRLSSFEQKTRAVEVEKESERLENFFQGLHKKYDLGDAKMNDKLERLVLSRAESLGRDPTDGDLERFFKEEYDAFSTLIRSHGEKQFRSQQVANQQGKDTSAGGGTPSSAPVQPKSLKEARKAMEEHLSKTGF